MSTLVLMALTLSPAQVKDDLIAIKGYDELVTTHWSRQTEGKDDKGNRTQELQVLLFFPEKTEDSGASIAWLLKRISGDRGIASYSAWRGTYRISRGKRKSDDSAVMALAMAKEYLGSRSTDGDIEWSLNTRFKPKLAFCTISLDDDSFEKQRLEFSVTQATFADESGEFKREYYEPQGLIEMLQGRGEERRPRHVEFLTIGGTYRFKPAILKDVDFIKDPPPALRLRSNKPASAGGNAALLAPKPPVLSVKELHELAVKACDKEDYSSAVEHLTNALQVDKEDASLYYERGWCLTRLKEYQRARKDFMTGLELRPKAGILHAAAAECCYHLADTSSCRSHYDKAVEFEPDDARILNDYAWRLATSSNTAFRDGKRAVELAQRALRVKEKNGACMDTLAAAYAETGDFQSAITWQRMALPLLEYDKDGAQKRLKLYEEQTPYRE